MPFQVRRTLLLLLPVLVLLAGAASARAASYTETESNDTTATADGPLLSGVSWTGAMQTTNDADYYVFYVAQKTQVHITLWNTLPDTEDGPYGDLLMDIDGANGEDDTISGTHDVSNGGNETVDYTLDRGRYYAVVYGDYADPGVTYRVD